MDDGPPVLPLPPPTLEPISRPSSTSTSASLPQLPGISSLAAGSSATSSPQMRPSNIPPPMYSTGSSPAATTGGGGNNPTCQNCQTSTTPLWRRDEFGSVLCNACGLFLKLHNRPRPISLKTDVIKSRNRVKNTGMRPDMAKKKQQQVQPQPYHPPNDPNGQGLDAQSTAAAATAQAARRASQKVANGHADGSRSPVSRTGTPSMYPPASLPGYPPLPDPAALPGAFGAYASPGRPASPMNGERPRDSTPPATLEQLMATNAGLNTRVGELELINKLYNDRVDQLEAAETAAKHSEAALRDRLVKTEAQVLELQQQSVDAAVKLQELQKQHEAEIRELRQQLEASQQMENSLKRRLDEGTGSKATNGDVEEESGPPAKKIKLVDDSASPATTNEPTPAS